MRLWAAWTEERVMGGHVERSAMMFSEVTEKALVNVAIDE
jgi:hypothetical protein